MSDGVYSITTLIDIQNELNFTEKKFPTYSLTPILTHTDETPPNETPPNETTPNASFWHHISIILASFFHHFVIILASF